MAEPARWLDREACARYICVRVDELPRLQKRGLLPAPSLHLGPRCPRWDRQALDARFDPSAASRGRRMTLAEALTAKAG